VSKTVAGGFRGFEFWVHDVCQALLWAEMIGVVEDLPPKERPDWTTELLPRLREHAALGDLYVPLEEWAGGHEEEFVELVARARRRLAERGTVTPQEAARWIVLDDLPVIWRGDEPIETAPVVEFADAVVEIVRGVHPPAPPGRQWYFDIRRTPDGPATVEIAE